MWDSRMESPSIRFVLAAPTCATQAAGHEKALGKPVPKGSRDPFFGAAAPKILSCSKLLFYETNLSTGRLPQS